MGNRQSVIITHQTADHDGKVKNDEANGHVTSGLDLTDAVNGEASLHQETESDPVTVTVNTMSAAVFLEANGTQGRAPTVSGEATCNQVSATTASDEQKVPLESSTPTKGTQRMFSKMFSKKSTSVSPASEALEAAEIAIINVMEVQNLNSQIKPITAEANGTVSAEQKKTSESKDTTKQSDSPKMFKKMFKKKTLTVSPASEANVAAEAPIVPAIEAQSQKSEPTDIKASTQAENRPQGEASIPSTSEVTQDSTQPEESSTEENSVMNFFKTFVTSTKTTKEASATPDVSKQQVQEASKIPPPPPPAPPKMESKAEPAVKKEDAPPIEAAAATAKEPEPPSKSKTKDSPFGKLFRTKPVLKEETNPVEIQVDASKTSTLEASAKLEPPPALKAEEKKAEKKPSPFANLLKPKGSESKKETPAAPTAPAEAAPSTKAKEEPKPAAAPATASQDNKSVESTDNSSPSTSRKLEKRNSIHQFFKNLSQKRHSDAGVQTEPVAPEKAK